jgi:hypothetical protein
VWDSFKIKDNTWVMLIFYSHEFTFFLVTADPPLFLFWHSRRGHRDDSNEPMYVSIGVRTAMSLLCTWCFVMGDLLLFFVARHLLGIL